MDFLPTNHFEACWLPAKHGDARRLCADRQHSSHGMVDRRSPLVNFLGITKFGCGWWGPNCLETCAAQLAWTSKSSNFEGYCQYEVVLRSLWGIAPYLGIHAQSSDWLPRTTAWKVSGEETLSPETLELGGSSRAVTCCHMRSRQLMSSFWDFPGLFTIAVIDGNSSDELPLGLVHNKVNSGGIAPEYCILL